MVVFKRQCIDYLWPQESPVFLLVSVCSVGQLYWHHLGTCSKCRVSGPSLDLLNQKLHFIKIDPFHPLCLGFVVGEGLSGSENPWVQLAARLLPLCPVPIPVSLSLSIMPFSLGALSYLWLFTIPVGLWCPLSWCQPLEGWLCLFCSLLHCAAW